MQFSCTQHPQTHSLHSLPVLLRFCVREVRFLDFSSRFIFSSAFLTFSSAFFLSNSSLCRFFSARSCFRFSFSSTSFTPSTQALLNIYQSIRKCTCDFHTGFSSVVSQSGSRRGNSSFGLKLVQGRITNFSNSRPNFPGKSEELTKDTVVQACEALNGRINKQTKRLIEAYQNDPLLCATCLVIMIFSIALGL